MNEKLAPLGLIILAIGLAYFYIYPTYTDGIVAKQEQVATYSTALDAATKFTNNEKNLLAQSQNISASDLARLEWYMPDSIDKMRFVDSLNHLGITDGVALSGYSIAVAPSSGAGTAATSSDAARTPASPNAAGATNSLDVGVTGVGTYDSFQALMLAIEQSAPILDVTQLSIKGTDTGVYTYSMNIRTYWLK
jgi:hypothetical protein